MAEDNPPGNQPFVDRESFLPKHQTQIDLTEKNELNYTTVGGYGFIKPVPDTSKGHEHLSEFKFLQQHSELGVYSDASKPKEQLSSSLKMDKEILEVKKDSNPVVQSASLTKKLKMNQESVQEIAASNRFKPSKDLKSIHATYESKEKNKYDINFKSKSDNLISVPYNSREHFNLDKNDTREKIIFFKDRRLMDNCDDNDCTEHRSKNHELYIENKVRNQQQNSTERRYEGTTLQSLFGLGSYLDIDRDQSPFKDFLNSDQHKINRNKPDVEEKSAELLKEKHNSHSFTVKKVLSNPIGMDPNMGAERFRSPFQSFLQSSQEGRKPKRSFSRSPDRLNYSEVSNSGDRQSRKHSGKASDDTFVETTFCTKGSPKAEKSTLESIRIENSCVQENLSAVGDYLTDQQNSHIPQTGKVFNLEEFREKLRTFKITGDVAPLSDLKTASGEGHDKYGKEKDQSSKNISDTKTNIISPNVSPEGVVRKSRARSRSRCQQQTSPLVQKNSHPIIDSMFKDILRMMVTTHAKCILEEDRDLQTDLLQDNDGSCFQEDENKQFSHITQEQIYSMMSNNFPESESNESNIYKDEQSKLIDMNKIPDISCNATQNNCSDSMENYNGNTKQTINSPLKGSKSNLIPENTFCKVDNVKEVNANNSNYHEDSFEGEYFLGQPTLLIVDNNEENEPEEEAAQEETENTSVPPAVLEASSDGLISDTSTQITPTVESQQIVEPLVPQIRWSTVPDREIQQTIGSSDSSPRILRMNRMPGREPLDRTPDTSIGDSLSSDLFSVLPGVEIVVTPPTPENEIDSNEITSSESENRVDKEKKKKEKPAEKLAPVFSDEMYTSILLVNNDAAASSTPVFTSENRLLSKQKASSDSDVKILHMSEITEINFNKEKHKSNTEQTDREKASNNEPGTSMSVTNTNSHNQVCEKLPEDITSSNGIFLPSLETYNNQGKNKSIYGCFQKIVGKEEQSPPFDNKILTTSQYFDNFCQNKFKIPYSYVTGKSNEASSGQVCFHKKGEHSSCESKDEIEQDEAPIVCLNNCRLSKTETKSTKNLNASVTENKHEITPVNYESKKEKARSESKKITNKNLCNSETNTKPLNKSSILDTKSKSRLFKGFNDVSSKTEHYLTTNISKNAQISTSLLTTRSPELKLYNESHRSKSSNDISNTNILRKYDTIWPESPFDPKPLNGKGSLQKLNASLLESIEETGSISEDSSDIFWGKTDSTTKINTGLSPSKCNTNYIQFINIEQIPLLSNSESDSEIEPFPKITNHFTENENTGNTYTAVCSKVTTVTNNGDYQGKTVKSKSLNEFVYCAPEQTESMYKEEENEVVSNQIKIQNDAQNVQKSTCKKNKRPLISRSLNESFLRDSSFRNVTMSKGTRHLHLTFNRNVTEVLSIHDCHSWTGSEKGSERTPSGPVRTHSMVNTRENSNPRPAVLALLSNEANIRRFPSYNDLTELDNNPALSDMSQGSDDEPLFDVISRLPHVSLTNVTNPNKQTDSTDSSKTDGDSLEKETKNKTDRIFNTDQTKSNVQASSAQISITTDLLDRKIKMFELKQNSLQELINKTTDKSEPKKVISQEMERKRSFFENHVSSTDADLGLEGQMNQTLDLHKRAKSVPSLNASDMCKNVDKRSGMASADNVHPPNSPKSGAPKLDGVRVETMVTLFESTIQLTKGPCSRSLSVPETSYRNVVANRRRVRSNSVVTYDQNNLTSKNKDSFAKLVEQLPSPPCESVESNSNCDVKVETTCSPSTSKSPGKFEKQNFVDKDYSAFVNTTLSDSSKFKAAVDKDKALLKQNSVEDCKGLENMEVKDNPCPPPSSPIKSNENSPILNLPVKALLINDDQCVSSQQDYINTTAVNSTIKLDTETKSITSECSIPDLKQETKSSTALAVPMSNSQISAQSSSIGSEEDILQVHAGFKGEGDKKGTGERPLAASTSLTDLTKDELRSRPSLVMYQASSVTSLQSSETLHEDSLQSASESTHSTNYFKLLQPALSDLCDSKQHNTDHGSINQAQPMESTSNVATLPGPSKGLTKIFRDTKDIKSSRKPLIKIDSSNTENQKANPEDCKQACAQSCKKVLHWDVSDSSESESSTTPVYGSAQKYKQTDISGENYSSQANNSALPFIVKDPKQQNKKLRSRQKRKILTIRNDSEINPLTNLKRKSYSSERLSPISKRLKMKPHNSFSNIESLASEDRVEKRSSNHLNLDINDNLSLHNPVLSSESVSNNGNLVMKTQLKRILPIKEIESKILSLSERIQICEQKIDIALNFASRSEHHINKCDDILAKSTNTINASEQLIRKSMKQIRSTSEFLKKITSRSN